MIHLQIFVDDIVEQDTISPAVLVIAVVDFNPGNDLQRRNKPNAALE